MKQPENISKICQRTEKSNLIVDFWILKFLWNRMIRLTIRRRILRIRRNGSIVCNQLVRVE